jgi:hypothetical protein
MKTQPRLDTSTPIAECLEPGVDDEALPLLTLAIAGVANRRPLCEASAIEPQGRRS